MRENRFKASEAQCEATDPRSVFVTDPYLVERILAERKVSESAGHDEVWDGLYVIPPMTDVLHQWIISQLCWAVFSDLGDAAGGRVIAGVNVSDRAAGWEHNYRVPDVVVLLKNNPGRDCGTHWFGGPDLVVEVVTRNDHAREKLAFYAKVGVRELLVVDRDPWQLELYRLADGALGLAGASTVGAPAALATGVLPLTFRLEAGGDRPRIVVERADGAGRWTV